MRSLFRSDLNRDIPRSIDLEAHGLPFLSLHPDHDAALFDNQSIANGNIEVQRHSLPATDRAVARLLRG